MTVEFVEMLPDRKTGGSRPVGHVAAAIAELKSRPGQWAKVGENQSVAAAHYWQQRGCETTTRDQGLNEQGQRRCTLYARWPEDGAS